MMSLCKMGRKVSDIISKLKENGKEVVDIDGKDILTTEKEKNETTYEYRFDCDEGTYNFVSCARKENPSPQKQEYGDTNSDVEEIETDTTGNHTVSQLRTQNLQQYRTTEEYSCKELDSEDDSLGLLLNNVDSSSSNINNSDSNSDSDQHNIADMPKKKWDKAKKASKKKKHVKNELDNLPPIEDLQISVPEVLCNPLGEV